MKLTDYGMLGDTKDLYATVRNRKPKSERVTYRPDHANGKGGWRGVLVALLVLVALATIASQSVVAIIVVYTAIGGVAWWLIQWPRIKARRS